MTHGLFFLEALASHVIGLRELGKAVDEKIDYTMPQRQNSSDFG